MSRRIVAAFAMLVVAAPLSAQAAAKSAMIHMDHTMKVEGAGPLPKGWMGRADEDANVEDSKVVVMGSGWHVTSGPAAIYWNDQAGVKGPFTASVTIRQTKAPEHPEAYGIFFMGRDLKDAKQNYAYFLVRGDGKFLVNHRAGEELHKIMPWTDNAAVNKADNGGVATNTLTVDATKKDSIRLLVNGKQVHALGGDHFGSTDGIVGVRVNHNLDVHISNFVVTPKK
jgi:hypothetical protein